MITYIFCKLFHITRVKTFITYPDGKYSRVYLKTIPNILYMKSADKYFIVDKVLTEVINETLVYNWIKLEEYLPNNKKIL